MRHRMLVTILFILSYENTKCAQKISMRDLEVVLGPTKQYDSRLSREEECSNILVKLDEWLSTGTKLTVVSKYTFQYQTKHNILEIR